MTTLRVHFDGRVLVPEGPVDLLQGGSLEVREIGELKPVGIRINKISGLPEFDVPADAAPISSEDVRRAIEDESRPR